MKGYAAAGILLKQTLVCLLLDLALFADWDICVLFGASLCSFFVVGVTFCWTVTVAGSCRTELAGKQAVPVTGLGCGGLVLFVASCCAMTTVPPVTGFRLHSAARLQWTQRIALSGQTLHQRHGTPHWQWSHDHRGKHCKRSSQIAKLSRVTFVCCCFMS